MKQKADWKRKNAFFSPNSSHTHLLSARLRLLTLFAAAGLEEAFRSMASPAESFEPPTGALTYSKADLKHTAQRFSEYGVRLLAPDELTDQLPLYPKSLPPNPASRRKREISLV